jgi:hypothetical protein
MTDDVGQDQVHLAVRLALESLAPLCGLDVDASRVALLQPLVTVLLRQGEQLVRTTEPAVEPFFIGVDVLRTVGPT